MAFLVRVAVALALTLLIPSATVAQDINLGAGGADLVWRGETTQSRAGVWMDQGALNAGDTRRDLVIGAPGGAGTAGKVYVLFGGPTRIGQLSLSAAETVITGPGAGDRFGAATAVGNILNLTTDPRRSLAVGAPGAAGGAGVVYLYSGNFAHGAQLTTANAVATVTGAPGDQLGASLATADLDGDGFREIIMGAPGNSRVYILYGSSTLSGARAPDVTITGAGLGGVLAAGDITDDGRYDLLIGVPGQSLIYMIKGRLNGTRLPAAMHVSRDEDAYFYGVGPDRAGSSLHVGDVNGDGKQDLFIGAPYGGASETGAVYVLLSNRNRGALSLTQADLTLYGPVAGAHMGHFVSTGDMNRDGRDDIAMLTEGGANGVGEVLVYYGRSGSLGTPGPSGFPVMDMGIPSNVSRRIIGDSNGGPIASSVIFEVTGEGARDVIVGAPHAASSSGTESGLVYFSNSPRLSVRSGTTYIAAVQGGTGTAPVSVFNQSTVWITWEATPRATWQSVNPSEGSAIAGQPGSFVVSASAAGLAPGRYDQNVTVSSTSPDLEMFRNVPITMAVFSTPTVTANQTFPAQRGTPITWTASTNAGSLGVLYQFWRFDNGTGWHLVQDYSASNTYTWTPGGGDVGEHYIQVWMKSTISPSNLDVYAATGAFSIVTPVPAVQSFESDATFPAALGTSIRWTANVTGGIGPLQYQFWAFKQNEGWSLIRAYGTSNTVLWTPSTTGTYAVQVWVRNAGSTATYDAWAGSSTFEISTTAPLTVQSLTADSSMPLKVGTVVTWTARASGGTAGPLQYKFWRYNAGTGAWTMLQDWSTARSYVWPVAAGDEGQYSVQVWVRNAGSSAIYDAWAGSPMFNVQRDPVVVDSLTADRTFPTTTGTTVTWTAAARGGANLRYKFYVFNSATGWSLLRDYASGNSAQWTPTQAGSYSIQVWVRSADSTADYDAWKGTTVVVQPPS
jgi:hypothetical protein